MKRLEESKAFFFSFHKEIIYISVKNENKLTKKLLYSVDTF